MSAKYYSTTHTHPFPWESVAAAIFRRYPNPFSSHVLSEDTLYREVRGDTLYTRRFLTKTNKLPAWGERFFSGIIQRYVPLVEESFVDRTTQSIVTYTRNVGLSNFMTAVEKVSYRPCPQNPSVTIAVKEVWVDSRFYGLRSAVKNFGVERFKKNCLRATDGFNHVLEQLQERQHYLSQVPKKKWREMKSKGESVMKNRAQVSATEALRGE